MDQVELEAKIRGAVIGEEVYQEQPNTFVLLHLEPGYTAPHIFGFSKVRHPDEFNAEMGVKIARIKAIATYADELTAQFEDVMALVKWVEAHRKAIKATFEKVTADDVWDEVLTGG